MPVEQTDWNGVLFSEAGSLWRLFGSAELIRISRAHCASPSSSLFFFSFLCIYTRFLFLFSFSTVLYFWCLGNYCYNHPTCRYCQSTLEQTQPTLPRGDWTKVCAQGSVCIWVCYGWLYISLRDVQKLIAGGKMSLPTSSLWLPPSHCPMWCWGSKTNLRCSPNHEAKCTSI